MQTDLYLSCGEYINAAVAGSFLQTVSLLHHNERRYYPPKRITDAGVLIALEMQYPWHEVAQRGVVVHTHLLQKVSPDSKELDSKQRYLVPNWSSCKLHHPLACMSACLCPMSIALHVTSKISVADYACIHQMFPACTCLAQHSARMRSRDTGTLRTTALWCDAF
jgi:hypothetical protein